MISQKELTVLVTGSDAPGFSSIVRSLKLSKKYKLKIISTDWKTNLKGKYFANRSYNLPDNKAPEFITELLNVCEKEKVDIILPIRTDDQLPICHHMKDFSDIGSIPAVVTPNPGLMDTALNKLKMLEYLENVSGLKTLDYKVAKTSDDLIRAMKEIGYPKVPVAVKPAHASGSRGFRVLDPRLDRRKSFFMEKPTSVFTTEEELLNIIGDSFPDMLVMEYLTEPEYTVDVLCYKGRTFAIVPRRRLKMVGGITVNGLIEKLP
ncbi:MAG: ATP-grasp domain-containing protein, partial [Candidatus Hodarchaeales archaeon]